MRRPTIGISLTLLLVAGVFLLGRPESGIAQQARADAAETPAAPSEDEALRPYVIPKGGPFHSEEIAVANTAAIMAWARSGHSDAKAPAFTHWDAEGAIPPACSTCHSGAGFRSFHGLDGSAPGLPDTPMPVGGVVDCETCHSPRLSEVREVRLASGVMHPVAGVEAACTTCHQSRTAGVTVANAVGDRDPDTPDPELSFINPHYATATSTWLGGFGASGYHYPGKDYSGRFFHARPVATCVSCHEPHTLKVSTETCLTCHENGNPRDIRISRRSHDGSGNLAVGIHSDIQGLSARLMEAMLAYAREVAGVPMIHDPHRHPYFFADANGDGVADLAEGAPLRYAAFTPRLLRAAFNWKLVTADHGAYAHNPHYALELLYDSIEDLAGPMGADITDLGMRP